METRTIVDNDGKQIEVKKYESKDEPEILQPFLIWYTSAIISENFKFRKPPIPEDFTEKISCYILNYWHKHGAGVDAFEIDGDKILKVEIKATTTKSGFQGNINAENFDFLIWFDFSAYKSLEYRIFKFSKDLFENKPDKINLKKIVDDENLSPIKKGKVGVVFEKE